MADPMTLANLAKVALDEERKRNAIDMYSPVMPTTGPASLTGPSRVQYGAPALPSGDFPSSVNTLESYPVGSPPARLHNQPQPSTAPPHWSAQALTGIGVSGQPGTPMSPVSAQRSREINESMFNTSGPIGTFADYQNAMSPSRRSKRPGNFQGAGMSLSEFLKGGTNPDAGLFRAPQAAPEPDTFTAHAIAAGTRPHSVNAEGIPQFSSGTLSPRPGVDVPTLAQQRRMGGEMAPWEARALARAQGAQGSEVNALANQALGRREDTGGLTPFQAETLARQDREFNYKVLADDYERTQNQLAKEGKVDEQKASDLEAYNVMSADSDRIGGLVNEALGLSARAGTTGLSGTMIKNIPGTKANQLKAVLEVVTSKVALDRLAQVKATGATLGQISEKELTMLQNSFDALQQNLSGERLRSALLNFATRLNNIESEIASSYEKKYGEPPRSGQPDGDAQTNRDRVEYTGGKYEFVD